MALFNMMPIKAHVVAQLFGADVDARTGDDPGLFHLLYPHMNGAGADGEVFRQFGVRCARVVHQSVEDAAIEIIDLINFRHLIPIN